MTREMTRLSVAVRSAGALLLCFGFGEVAWSTWKEREGPLSPFERLEARNLSASCLGVL